MAKNLLITYLLKPQLMPVQESQKAMIVIILIEKAKTGPVPVPVQVIINYSARGVEGLDAERKR